MSEIGFLGRFLEAAVEPFETKRFEIWTRSQFCSFFFFSFWKKIEIPEKQQPFGWPAKIKIQHVSLVLTAYQDAVWKRSNRVWIEKNENNKVTKSREQTKRRSVRKRSRLFLQFLMQPQCIHKQISGKSICIGISIARCALICTFILPLFSFIVFDVWNLQ